MSALKFASIWQQHLLFAFPFCVRCLESCTLVWSVISLKWMVKNKGRVDLTSSSSNSDLAETPLLLIEYRIDWILTKNNSAWLALEVFVIDSMLNLLPWLFCFVLRGTLKMCMVDAMRITYLVLVLATETLKMTQFICHKILLSEFICRRSTNLGFSLA